ncbi:BRO family protein [uncultured Rheinheimera sp.]|uniref:BRO-N domain-containing protein n=1 Tax=uncultured Rheinheimera sp. TaxID=400532 RepID=UPI002592E234|nr:BRO family protein [uncultured Rheinheimera sp.]
MSQLQQFTFSHDGMLANVRIQLDDKGQPWFVAKDVAELLGYADTAKAIRTHCKGVAEMATPSAGGEQRAKVIKESDVYRLIFRSQLAAAETFEAWVVEEVLPSIRQQGFYQMQASVKAATPIISLQKQALTIITKLQKEKDPDLRGYLHNMLQNVSSMIGQTAPPLLAIGKSVDPTAEPELAEQFWQNINTLRLANVELNHSFDPALVAISMNEYLQACSKHGIKEPHKPTLLKELKNSKRFKEANVTVRSTITTKSIKCWVFNAAGGEA